MSRNADAKRLTPPQVTGQRGVNLVEKIVLEMGCAWHPTNQSLDVGIDGEIELVDPANQRATNAVIRVQSKATLARFTAETESTFEFLCSPRDLDYWLTGNTPVILVVSRPHTGEAYWVSVNEYFSSPMRRKTARVVFDKATMRFDSKALPKLAAIAAPRSRGLYFAPPPREEILYSNLLAVAEQPKRLWLASTDLRRRGDVFRLLRSAGVDYGEFSLHNKRILAARDLTDAGWESIVDRGTVEEFDAADWSHTNDRDRYKQWVEILRGCLDARAKELGLRFRRDDAAYYFPATKDLSDRKVSYVSVKEASERRVFQAYRYTKGQRIGEVSYYRHSACVLNLRRYDRQWYLEITPTYHFTSDGHQRHPYAHKLTSGIKRQEKQGAVMYQLVMWASLFRGSPEGEDPFFSTSRYDLVRFGALQTFGLEAGIDDDAWLPNEDKATAEVGQQTLGDLPLFYEEPNPYTDQAVVASKS